VGGGQIPVLTPPADAHAYYPKLKYNYFHHCWEPWHYFKEVHNFLRGCLWNRCSNNVDTACPSETNTRQADEIP